MTGSHMIWAVVFLMVILKIPIVYLCSVVYYAIKAEPRPGRGDGAGVPALPEWPPSAPERLRRRPPRRPQRPHGGPSRAYARSVRVAQARAGRIGGR